MQDEFNESSELGEESELNTERPKAADAEDTKNETAIMYKMEMHEEAKVQLHYNSLSSTLTLGNK